MKNFASRNMDLAKIKHGGMIDVQTGIDDGLLPKRFCIVWVTKEGIDLCYTPDVVLAAHVAKGLQFAIDHGWDVSLQSNSTVERP